MNIQMLKIPKIIISLNEDSSLHVDWEQIRLEKLQQQQDAEAMLLLDDTELVPAESQDTQQQQSQGFSIISETEETCEPGVDVLIDGQCQPIKTDNVVELVEDKNSGGGGGCLIATATYGTELSPQVQMLRELRDNIVLTTQSGNSFMNFFNYIYYSFSPHIADYERENPLFKEMVKLAITPMVSSLSLLNYVTIDTESDMVTYGIGVILLNVAMYVGIPVLGIYKVGNLYIFYKPSSLSATTKPNHKYGKTWFSQIQQHLH